MKKSEELKIKRDAEDNDLKALGIGKQVIRETRSENFEDKWLPKFKEKLGDNIYLNGNHYTLFYDSQTYDFFPKANRLLIRESSKWINPGLQYLVKHILTVLKYPLKQGFQIR
jgi:hypothetical protein